MANDSSLFRSFFLGGFECSTHYLESGKRLDEIAATKHDLLAARDYQLLHSQGIRTVREGLRWHLIEKQQGRYDFSSLLPMLRAALETKTQVIWDLCHYGWPDWLNIFEPGFVTALANLARQFARLWQNETDEILFVAPINEISFFSWGGGEFAGLNPYARGRGSELKEQLVRSAIAAIEATWEVDSQTRIAHVDPLIHVLPADPRDPKQAQDAEDYRVSQFEAWDMLGGRQKPHLGGQEKYLDIIGGNYYVHNQWILGGSFISQDHARYRPFREILLEVYARYRRPFFIAETGIEDDLRPSWFRYVCNEAAAALQAGVDLNGICLYPIVNHPGWVDDRHCHNGLWDYPDEKGDREIYQPLADELQHQRKIFAEIGKE